MDVFPPSCPSQVRLKSHSGGEKRGRERPRGLLRLVCRVSSRCCMWWPKKFLALIWSFLSFTFRAEVSVLTSGSAQKLLWSGLWKPLVALGPGVRGGWVPGAGGVAAGGGAGRLSPSCLATTGARSAHCSEVAGQSGDNRAVPSGGKSAWLTGSLVRRCMQQSPGMWSAAASEGKFGRTIAELFGSSGV